MRLKLTLRRPEGRATDLTVTADATATVNDIATALYAADPSRGDVGVPPRLTLQVEQAGSVAGRVLDPGAEILVSGLRPGATVSVAQVSEQFALPGSDRGAPAAVLRVLAGPDAGAEFPLPVGTSYLGRDRDMDIRLTDPLISKRHARLTIGEGVEIVDTNSANGLLIGGTRVTRSALTSADSVVLGDTTVAVVPLQRAGSHAPSSPVIEFNRSPRVVRRVAEKKLPAPKPPAVPSAGKFPMLAMIAPLIMGAVLFGVTRNVLSVVFIALSPLLMIGSYIDSVVTARKTFASQKEHFLAGIDAMTEQVDRAHVVERAVRLAATPSVADAVEAVDRLSPLLWTHRPEHPGFLTVRLGTGIGASHTVVEMPGTNDTVPDMWQKLEELSAHAATVSGVPVVGDLRVSGSLGLAGAPDSVDPVARGIVLQLVALHSPAELVIAALASPTSRAGWEWLEWLPHTGSQHSPLAGAHLADNPGACAALLDRLEELVEDRLAAAGSTTTDRGHGPLDPTKAGTAVPPVVPSVVVVLEDDAPVSRPRMTRLLERGADVNVHVVWVAQDVSALPAACRTFLLVGEGGGTSGEVRTGELRFPVDCERLAVDDAHRLARALTAVVDVGAPVDDASDLPRSVSYVSLAGMEIMQESAAVVERWRETGSVTPRDGSAPVRRKKDATLHALVGHAGSEPLSLDLRTHGPHALVGGTTGAGKSEFLQAWVLGMAAAHSPDRVTFLFVDYKGGAAFADCVELPHTVGLVTDLSPHLVRRALTSLRAELRYREHLLNRKKAKDLVSLERTGDPEAPPSLLIVVDEFAALVNEVPEFVDGVVDVAQRGRSLGLHLILATQRPAGVIKDNLRANTNLRVALRMADEDDSTDILGVPMAAHFDPSIPGRGAVKTGPGRITPFQTGYAGGWTTAEPERARIEIAEMAFGEGTAWEVPQPATGPERDPGPTDIARTVSTIRAAARDAGIPDPRRPWLPELAAGYDIALLPNPRTDARLLLGVVDDPRTQSQPTVSYEPDRDGNMAIFGAGGSGKSTTLRTLAVSAAVTPRGGPVQVYAVDFAGNALRLLEDLPHVGAVVSGDDDERLARLLRMLRETVDERSARYSAVRAGSIGEYRTLAGAPQEPRILLLVDGVAAFREAYEFSVQPLFNMFSQIAADGRQVGVHVIVTGDRPNAVPTSLASTIQRRLVLRLASEDDYLLMGVSKDVLTTASPPGRGVLDDREVQVAVLGGDANVAVQARELSRLAESMRRNGVVQAPQIGRLPVRVLLGDLPVAGRPVIGIDDENLAPAHLDPTGTLLLSGPPGSGRSTALVTLAQAVRRTSPGIRIAHLAPRRTSLAGLPVFDSSLISLDEVAEAAEQLSQAVESGRVRPGGLMVVVESITEFTGTSAEAAVDRLVRLCAREGQFVVGEAEGSTWGQAWTLAQPFKAGRRGLLLMPEDMDGDTLLGTPLGRIRRADFPPGRGFLVAGGRGTKLQLAVPE